MMRFDRCPALGLACAFAAALAARSSARGDVDLEWRPALQTVFVGETVHVGLYAVLDPPEVDQWTSAMDVIVAWTPEHLDLVHVVDAEPSDWIFSGFADDSSLDGLNDTFADGNALYSAYAPFGDPVLVTPEGLLVTTFQFTALAEAPETVVMILVEFGQYSRTAVFDGETAGAEIQGALGDAAITIVPRPGDCDLDAEIDLDDYAAFQGCIDGPVGRRLPPACQCADLDRDGDVDLEDFSGFQMIFAESGKRSRESVSGSAVSRRSWPSAGGHCAVLKR